MTPSIMAELSADILQPIVKLIEEQKMPDWWLKDAGRIAYNLQVHTKGLMFDKVTGLYPNEHPDSQKHCVQSYESITKGSIWKAINNIIRVFNNSSYNIELSEKTKTAVETYNENEGSLFSQFLEDWVRYAIATDPNGICVTYPIDYTDDLYRYVCYKEIKYVSDEILIFVSLEESEIKVEMVDYEYTKEVFLDFNYEIAPGIPNTKHGSVRTFNRRLEKKVINPVYHVFTKERFIRFYKDDASESQLKYEFFNFIAPLETLPYFENGGKEIEDNLYESFVQDFVPFGNKALIADRNLRAIDLMFAYPRMSEVQQPCDECNTKGKIPCVTCPDGWEQCKHCKGSGYVSIQSPYKIYRKVKDSFDVDGKVFSTPSVEFYTPDVGIIDYAKEQPDIYIRKAEEAVFVQHKTDTGNVEAAKSKEIDREELYSWLANISKVLFNNLQMFLQNLENYLNASPIKVVVEKPYSFAILTESEAFEALDTMLKSSSPVPIKASQIDSFINKFISESSPVKQAFRILKKYDLLLYYSDEALASYKGMGSVSNKELIKHQKAYPILIQMYEQDKNLFDLEDDQIITRLSTEVDKYDLTKDLRTAVLSTVVNNAASA